MAGIKTSELSSKNVDQLKSQLQDFKKELFNSKNSLRRSIIVKEILDKPLAMRD